VSRTSFLNRAFNPFITLSSLSTLDKAHILRNTDKFLQTHKMDLNLTNPRSLRRQSQVSYAENSDMGFDSSLDNDDQNGSYMESGFALRVQSPRSSGDQERLDETLANKKRISHACDYCRRKKCKVCIL
jgi:hypothetical protein